MALKFGEEEFIDLELIDDSEDGQARAATDPATVESYAAEIEEGVTFPAVKLVKVGVDEYRIGDGYHRVRAHKQVGRQKILAEVAVGTARDAMIYGASEANRTNPKGLTRADKRRRASILLQDPEFAAKTARELARLSGYTHPTIEKMRAEPSGKFTTAAPDRLEAGTSYLLDYDNGEHGARTEWAWYPATKDHPAGYWMLAVETWLESVHFSGDYRDSACRVFHYGFGAEEAPLADYLQGFHGWRLVGVTAHKPFSQGLMANPEKLAEYAHWLRCVDLRAAFEAMPYTERHSRLENVRGEYKAMLGTLLDDESLAEPAADLIARQQQPASEGGREMRLELHEIERPLIAG
jgi:hypothetical protein